MWSLNLAESPQDNSLSHSQSIHIKHAHPLFPSGSHHTLIMTRSLSLSKLPLARVRTCNVVLTETQLVRWMPMEQHAEIPYSPS